MRRRRARAGGTRGRDRHRGRRSVLRRGRFAGAGGGFRPARFSRLRDRRWPASVRQWQLRARRQQPGVRARRGSRCSTRRGGPCHAAGWLGRLSLPVRGRLARGPLRNPIPALVQPHVALALPIRADPPPHGAGFGTRAPSPRRFGPLISSTGWTGSASIEAAGRSIGPSDGASTSPMSSPNSLPSAWHSVGRACGVSSAISRLAGPWSASWPGSLSSPGSRRENELRCIRRPSSGSDSQTDGVRTEIAAAGLPGAEWTRRLEMVVSRPD